MSGRPDRLKPPEANALKMMDGARLIGGGWSASV
jgi:hypothetical protein